MTCGRLSVMRGEQLANYILEVTSATGWVEDDDGVLRRYDERGEKRYEIYQIRMDNSGLSQTDFSLQVKGEMGGGGLT